jgi:hypothetical protein
MRARDRRGAILEKGAIREGCHTTRKLIVSLKVLVKAIDGVAIVVVDKYMVGR